MENRIVPLKSNSSNSSSKPPIKLSLPDRTRFEKNMHFSKNGENARRKLRTLSLDLHITVISEKLVSITVPESSTRIALFQKEKENLDIVRETIEDSPRSLGKQRG